MFAVRMFFSLVYFEWGGGRKTGRKNKGGGPPAPLQTDKS